MVMHGHTGIPCTICGFGSVDPEKFLQEQFVKNYNELHSGVTFDSSSDDLPSSGFSGFSGHSGSCGIDQDRLIKNNVIYRKNRKKINMSGPFPSTIKNKTKHK